MSIVKNIIPPFIAKYLQIKDQRSANPNEIKDYPLAYLAQFRYDPARLGGYDAQQLTVYNPGSGDAIYISNQVVKSGDVAGAFNASLWDLLVSSAADQITAFAYDPPGSNILTITTNFTTFSVDVTTGAFYAPIISRLDVLDSYQDVLTGITAHAGGGQALATPLSLGFNNVTVCVNAGDSALLPDVPAESWVYVKNNGATVCSIFPFVGDSIDSLGVNNAFNLSVGFSEVFKKIDATNWQSELGVLYSTLSTLQNSVTILQNSVTTLQSTALIEGPPVTINAASINNSGTSPVVVFPAIASKQIVPAFFKVQYNGGTTGFTGGLMVLKTAGAPTAWTNLISITNNTSFLNINPISSMAGTNVITNTSIVFTSSSGVNPSLGDGSVIITPYCYSLNP